MSPVGGARGPGVRFRGRRKIVTEFTTDIVVPDGRSITAPIRKSANRSR